MPFPLAERAIFPRGHGGRRMVGSGSEHADCFGFGRVRFGGGSASIGVCDQLSTTVIGVITAVTSLNEVAKMYCDNASSFHRLWNHCQGGKG
jgi:hypothetical protein